MSFRRSPLFYVGDKYKLLSQITTQFPDKINRFVEPFVGGGSVFLNVSANEYMLNDIDKNICGLHKFLETQSKNQDFFFKKTGNLINKYNLSKSYSEDVVPKKLKEKFKKVAYARYNEFGYNLMKEHYNKSKEKDQFELYLLLIYGFNRMLRFNSNNEFNLPVGNVDFNKNVELALKNYFNFVKNKKISWSNKDYKEFIKEITPLKDDFFYFDPPYLISSSEYNKLWSADDELELLALLDKLDKKRVNFAISNVIFHKGKHNKIFEKWMQQYNIINVSSNYISYHDNTQKQTKEVLVTNYEKTCSNL